MEPRLFEDAVHLDHLGDVRRQIRGSAADQFEHVTVESGGVHAVNHRGTEDTEKKRQS